MKKYLFISLLSILIGGCNSSPNDASDLNLESFEQRISYALGADMGGSFTNLPEELAAGFDKDEVTNGFFSAFMNDTTNNEECKEILNEAFANAQVSGIDTTKYDMDKISNCYGAMFGDMLRSSLTSKTAMDRIIPDVIKIGFRSALDKTDTLIPAQERQEMIINFNNDLNRMASREFMTTKKKEFAEFVQDSSYIVIEQQQGTDEPLALGKEYQILYTVTTIEGDTIISTIQDRLLSDEENARIINSEDIVLPEAWKKATQFMTVGGEYKIITSYDLAFGEKGLPSPNQNRYVIQPFQALILYSKVLKQQEIHTAIKERGKKVIALAKKEPNTYVDKSGFVLTTLKEGTGKKVQPNADVQVNYILKNSEGQIIENSYMRVARTGSPAPSFSLQGVVEGWKLAFPMMRVGGKYKLVLPYDLAYGEQGNQGIAPFETLTFEVEVLDTGAPGTLSKPRPRMPTGMN